MKCEQCIYCEGGQLPESYEEEWWCAKGYGRPEEDMGCNHILPLILTLWAHRPYIPYYINKLIRLVKGKKIKEVDETND